ncbi:hypothetical protein DA803_03280 [[Mycoplasma] phocae]|uniref:Uncharacterized protein n=1 Tax=[Mycoplasma] phocae TaxID=142651 RepID=A0A2Z5IQZ8_9BACT|nr:hypothetical protein [[Mycoplasma] phocae]AXE61092.1 hypothetical protein DA803_03280 [[Mycoplasma] phocae]
MESKDNINNGNRDSIENKNNSKNKKNKRKIIATTAMFLGILTPIVAVIAIPLSLNSKTNIKRSKYFSDDVGKVMVSESNDEIIFNQDSGNRVDIMSNNLGTIRRNVKDNKQGQGVRYKNEFKFFSASQDFRAFVTKKLNAGDTADIKSNKSLIYSVNLKEIFDEYNANHNKPLTTRELFVSIENLISSFTYYYYDKDSIHYYDQKEGYLGYITSEFFKKINKYIQEKKSTNFDLKEAKLEAYIEFESDFKKIKSVSFTNKVIIQVKPQTT